MTQPFNLRKEEFDFLSGRVLAISALISAGFKPTNEQIVAAEKIVDSHSQGTVRSNLNSQNAISHAKKYLLQIQKEIDQ